MDDESLRELTSTAPVDQLPAEQFGVNDSPPILTVTILEFSEQVPETVYADLFALLITVEEFIATVGALVSLITVVEAVVAWFPVRST